MKNSITKFLVISFCIISLGVGKVPEIIGQTTNPPAKAPEQEITIERVLSEVQLGLVDAQKEIADGNMPPLESVKLTLQTVLARKGGGKINLFIFAIGKKWEKERSQELVLTLKPPDPNAPRQISGLAGNLAEAIISAAKGVQAARDNKQLPLELVEFAAEFQFVVKSETSGGGKFEILPVTAEIEGNLAKTAVHKIAVTFAKPK